MFNFDCDPFRQSENGFIVTFIKSGFQFLIETIIVDLEIKLTSQKQVVWYKWSIRVVVRTL